MKNVKPIQVVTDLELPSSVAQGDVSQVMEEGGFHMAICKASSKIAYYKARKLFIVDPYHRNYHLCPNIDEDIQEMQWSPCGEYLAVVNYCGVTIFAYKNLQDHVSLVQIDHHALSYIPIHFSWYPPLAFLFVGQQGQLTFGRLCAGKSVFERRDIDLLDRPVCVEVANVFLQPVDNILHIAIGYRLPLVKDMLRILALQMQLDTQVVTPVASLDIFCPAEESILIPHGEEVVTMYVKMVLPTGKPCIARLEVQGDSLVQCKVYLVDGCTQILHFPIHHCLAVFVPATHTIHVIDDKALTPKVIYKVPQGHHARLMPSASGIFLAYATHGEISIGKVVDTVEVDKIVTLWMKGKVDAWDMMVYLDGMMETEMLACKLPTWIEGLASDPRKYVLLQMASWLLGDYVVGVKYRACQTICKLKSDTEFALSLPSWMTFSDIPALLTDLVAGVRNKDLQQRLRRHVPGEGVHAKSGGNRLYLIRNKLLELALLQLRCVYLLAKDHPVEELILYDQASVLVLIQISCVILVHTPQNHLERSGPHLIRILEALMQFYIIYYDPTRAATWKHLLLAAPFQFAKCAGFVNFLDNHYNSSRHSIPSLIRHLRIVPHYEGFPLPETKPRLRRHGLLRSSIALHAGPEENMEFFEGEKSVDDSRTGLAMEIDE